MSWDLDEGTIILDGRYRVGHRLGGGTFGTAYEVTRVADGLLAVVKQCNIKWTIELTREEAEDWEAHRRFEIELAFDARSRHLTQVLDSGLYEEFMHVVLEHGGRTLDAHAKTLDERILAADVVNWVGQACIGLRDLVAGGYECHRDLCPANILVRPCELLKLTDFGTTKVDDARKEWRTVAVIVGHLNYAAPELVIPTLGRADVRSDVFSLGVIAYELLTGDFPYPRCEGLSAAIDLFADPTIRPRPLHARGRAGALSSTQRAILERMVAYRRADRPTPEEALRALGDTAALSFRCLREGCAGRIPYDETACGVCGTPLDESSVLGAAPARPSAPPPAPKAPPPPLGPSLGRLVLHTRDGEEIRLEIRPGESKELGRATLAGKSGESRFVSRRHGRLWWEGGRFLIEDHESINGIRVNEMDLDPHVPAPLESGARVEVAHLVGEFETE